VISAFSEAIAALSNEANGEARSPQHPAFQGGLEAAEHSIDDGSPMQPAAREQAGLSIPALLMVSLEEDALDQVRELRDELGSRREGDVLTAADFEALDLVLDCADQIPEARAEARALLQDGFASILNEPLRRACSD
jgi:hypothetical protein